MKIQVIESENNETFIDFLALLQGGEISKRGLALLSGQKTVSEALTQNRDHIISIIVSDDAQLALLGLEQRITCFRLKKSLFEKLNQFGTKGPILVVRVPEIKLITPKTLLKGCSLFIPFQDPSNVGAVLRSAAAFEVDQVILGPGAAHPFHPRSMRGASGTLFLNKYFRLNSLEDLNELSILKIGLDMTGEKISDFIFPKDFILIPGVEGPGLKSFIDSKNIDKKINISMSSRVESLNAMVATSVVLAYMHSQRESDQ